jgi:surface protein
LYVVIIFSLFSCSAKKAGNQKFSFKVAGIMSGLPATGGTYIKMISPESTSLVKLDSNDTTVINYGTWNFQIVAFEGPVPLQGNVYCGEIPSFVVDATPSIPSVTLNSANCTVEPFITLVGDIFSLYREPFISKWRTTSPSESITLPLVPTYTYNFDVDWGDGSPVQTILSDSDPNKTHTYLVPGDYIVKLVGYAEAWNFQSYGTKLKIIEVINLGDMGWWSLAGAFYGCSNLTSFAGGITDGVLDMSQMFASTPALTTIDVSTFHTFSVSNMTNMFGGASAVTSLNLSQFDTSNVTNMSGMFTSTNALTSLDLSSFNTSAVTDMSSMFNSANSLTSLDLSSFSTISATNMSWMFANMTALTSLNINNFNTSNVTDMNFMFANSTSLPSLNLLSFNTPLVTDMSYMFSNTAALTSLDVSTFNTSNVTNMRNMFANLNLITNLDVSNFDTLNTLTMEEMFANMTNLSTLNTTNFDLTSAGSSINVFLGTSGVTVSCDQGGSPGTGTFFGKTCN